MGRLVALGKTRSRANQNLRGTDCRTWLELPLGRQQPGRRRTYDDPYDFVRIKLEFIKPFAATHTAQFTFRPEGDRTVVTWSMFGEKNLLAKVIGLFMNMDKMIGDQFEKGLAQLGSAAARR
jgi:hypothetical protein